jgi:uncharacterized protein (TIGR02001 family)
MPMTRTLLAALLAVAPSTAALAETEPELSFGLNATTNYIFRGTTQTDDRPALQGYVEGALGGFYAGAWASNVRLEEDRIELDLYAGFRNTVGDLDYDVGYVRYLYNESGDCCGEAFLALDYALAEAGTVGATYYYDFDETTTWFDVRAGWEVGDLFALDGAIGTDFGTLDLGPDDKLAWNLGATRPLTEIVAIDLRYHDSNYDPGRLVLSLAADF